MRGKLGTLNVLNVNKCLRSTHQTIIALVETLQGTNVLMMSIHTCELYESMLIINHYVFNYTNADLMVL